MDFQLCFAIDISLQQKNVRDDMLPHFHIQSTCDPMLS
jgi:hypothetical protein